MTGPLGLRSRLFLAFVAALAVSGALIVAIVYLGMRFVPSYEFVTVPAVAQTDGPLPTTPPAVADRSSVVVVRSENDIWTMALATSAAGMVLVVVVGLLAGRVVVRRLLAPLRAVNAAAATAAAGDLAYRVNATGPVDELKELADTFDAMLDEIQRLLAANQRFAANASHELLTPLTTTRTVLEVVTSGGSPEELAELAPMLVETNERNIAIVTALLRLATAEHSRAGTERVDLGALVMSTVAERRTAAAEHEIDPHVEWRQGCWVTGSAVLLGQVVLNLLDNALNYNVPGGRIDIVVEPHAETVTMTIRNTGLPVDHQLTELLFEPFYRADRSRISSDRSGHGLGLAIVRSVVHAHHGTVTATSNADGGLTVLVELPRHR